MALMAGSSAASSIRPANSASSAATARIVMPRLPVRGRCPWSARRAPSTAGTAARRQARAAGSTVLGHGVPGSTIVRARRAHGHGGQERIAVAGPDGLLADDLGHAAEIGRRLQPDRVRGPAADREHPLRGGANLAVGLDDVGRARRDALEDRSVHVAARVGQVEAEERTLRPRVVDGRPFAGEVGQAQQPPGALGAGLPPPRTRSANAGAAPASWSRNQRVSVPEVARPAIEACVPGKSQGAYQSRLSRTGRSVTSMMKMVEPYIIIISPGRLDADADRLGRGVDGAHGDGRALREPGLAPRPPRVTDARDLGRPAHLAAAARWARCRAASSADQASWPTS